MTPRGTLGLCCVHIAQLMTHPAIYTTPFTLQLYYKPLGILQRVTKRQKVHISNHNGLENLHNIKFFWHKSQSFPERGQRSNNFPLPQSRFLRTIDIFFFKQFYIILLLVYYSLTSTFSPHKYLQGNLISHDRDNGWSSSTSKLVKKYHFLISLYIKVGIQNMEKTGWSELTS